MWWPQNKTSSRSQDQNSKSTQVHRNTKFFYDHKWSGAQIYYSLRWWHVWQNNSSWQDSKIFMQYNNSKEMICQIDCNNSLQPFSICGLLKMLSGNVEPWVLCSQLSSLLTAEFSTDKRLIVFMIPFTETSEIVLGRKLKKNCQTTLFAGSFPSKYEAIILTIYNHQDLKAWNQIVTSLCKINIFFQVTLARAYMTNMETNHHIKWWQNSKAEEPPDQRGHRAVCHPGSHGQKARADTALGWTPSVGSHTDVFRRKAKAEISGWQQWFF